MHNSCTNAASNVTQHLHNKNTPYRDKLAYRNIKREYKHWLSKAVGQPPDALKTPHAIEVALQEI
jgi:hypothetical protein